MIVESGLCLIQEFDFSLFDPSWRTVDSYVTLISTCETEGHDPRRWLAIHQKVTEFIRDHYLKPVQSTLGAVALYTSELLRLVSSTYLSVDGRVSVASGYFWSSIIIGRLRWHIWTFQLVYVGWKAAICQKNSYERFLYTPFAQEGQNHYTEIKLKSNFHVKNCFQCKMNQRCIERVEMLLWPISSWYCYKRSARLSINLLQFPEISHFRFFSLDQVEKYSFKRW